MGRFGALEDYTSIANRRALAPVILQGMFGIFAVFQIYLFMPQLLADPSLGNTSVKGNLFLRNRLNVYIKILTSSDARQNKRFKGERGEKELINRQMDRRTDYHANKESGKQNREQNKCNEHSGKQETWYTKIKKRVDEMKERKQGRETNKSQRHTAQEPENHDLLYTILKRWVGGEVG
jgi:hypothetical protein